eukprot:scaffold61941_cov57-Phaeocystis_antarctica.AAC.5
MGAASSLEGGGALPCQNGTLAGPVLAGRAEAGTGEAGTASARRGWRVREAAAGAGRRWCDGGRSAELCATHSAATQMSARIPALPASRRQRGRDRLAQPELNLQSSTSLRGVKQTERRSKPIPIKSAARRNSDLPPSLYVV